MDNKKIILYCDYAIIAFLSATIFFLPFSIAGIESTVWPALFLFILKRVLGYRGDSAWGLLPRTNLNTAILFFAVANVLATIFSFNFALSLRALLGKELKFLALYFMFSEVINSKPRLKVILIIIISSVLLITTDAIVQYANGVDFLRGYKLARLTASFQTSIGFAGWLIVIIPLLSGLLITGKRMARWLKIILILCIALLCICLIATYTRGAWLGFILGFSLLAWFISKRLVLKVKLLSLLSVVILVSTFMLLPQSLKSKVTSIGRINFKYNISLNSRIKSIMKTTEGDSAPVRFGLWKESLRIIRDYNYLGCGLNTYSIVARNYKSFEGGGIYPHNSYLQMTAETGLPGLLSFLFIIFVFFIKGLIYSRQKKDFLVLGMLGGILAFLIHAFFDNHLYSLQLVVLFWYMLGLTVAVMKLDSDGEDASINSI